MPAALTLLLSGVFLVSGLAKLRDPAGMVVLLRQSLPPALPAFALARGLAVLELVLGAGLLAGVAPGPLATAAGVVLVAFTVALRIASRRAPEAVAACGCFGNVAGTPPGQALVRNALLVVAALVVAVRPDDGPWTTSPGDALGALTVAGGLVCAWLLGTALVRETRHAGAGARA